MDVTAVDLTDEKNARIIAAVTLRPHHPMHPTSDWKPSQPVALASVLCILMLGEDARRGALDPKAIVISVC